DRRQEPSELDNHSAGDLAFRQHTPGRAKLDMRDPAPALSGTDPQKRRLGYHRGIGVEPPEAACQRAVHSPEFLVDDRFKQQVAKKLQAESSHFFGDKQVHRPGFHVIRTAAVDAVVLDLASERILRPRLRAARNGRYGPSEATTGFGQRRPGGLRYSGAP